MLLYEQQLLYLETYYKMSWGNYLLQQFERFYLLNSVLFIEGKKQPGLALFIMTNRSSYRRCSVKKVFLEIFQNSQKNTCAAISFFDKVAGLRQSPNEVEA